MAQILISTAPTARPGPGREQWLQQLFAAKAVDRGGVVRRAVRDVERMVGRDRFIEAVAERGFHLVESGGQFVVICNAGRMQVHL
ncbi:hypothetical protein [Roseivivax sediminis]|uniref:N-(5'-phosphoribosyl)anthranilate isomerase n=1 Tax=Roseivivax sediminis TaxID=936889 RepID=A0A1I1T235_9RHOB|nr:hypothetical protein [Roseivivax sediminis]SFD52706.1 hypothetical protein SAMN04515678_101444 [Roseivivax sediminis]